LLDNFILVKTKRWQIYVITTDVLVGINSSSNLWNNEIVKKWKWTIIQFEMEELQITTNRFLGNLQIDISVAYKNYDIHQHFKRYIKQYSQFDTKLVKSLSRFETTITTFWYQCKKVYLIRNDHQVTYPSISPISGMFVVGVFRHFINSFWNVKL
jgi:hypothetical protein